MEGKEEKSTVGSHRTRGRSADDDPAWKGSRKKREEAFGRGHKDPRICLIGGPHKCKRGLQTRGRETTSRGFEGRTG